MSSLPDATMAVPHYLYRCYGADDVLLYIGVARNVSDRMYHHLHMCNMGKQPNGTLRCHMVRYEVERFETKLEVRAAERHAIRTERPLVNRQHNVTRFRKVGTARYGLVEPAHPISVEAFPDSPRISQDVAA